MDGPALWVPAGALATLVAWSAPHKPAAVLACVAGILGALLLAGLVDLCPDVFFGLCVIMVTGGVLLVGAALVMSTILVPVIYVCTQSSGPDGLEGEWHWLGKLCTIFGVEVGGAWLTYRWLLSLPEGIIPSMLRWLERAPLAVFDAYLETFSNACLAIATLLIGAACLWSIGKWLVHKHK